MNRVMKKEWEEKLPPKTTKKKAIEVKAILDTSN